LDEPRMERLIKNLTTFGPKFQAQLFNNATLVQPVTLYLFKDHVSINRLGPALFGGDFPSNVGPQNTYVRDNVLNMEICDGILLNRFVYYNCLANAPGCPRWLRDGIAGLFTVSGYMRDVDYVVGRADFRIEWYLEDAKAGTAVTL